MLNMPGLKFDKSIKYLENQLNIQTNNKQLILDIITNVGLIINNNSSNNNEELHGVLDIANDFLQDISNNITILEQLNLEISNITEELNGIMKEQAQNSKTKEYYIAALSNIKNHITQYTEKFQEFQKKLDIDNDDFNEFINDNNFKYTFDTIEDSSNNTDTYELTSFSVNDAATIVSTNNEISDEEKEQYNAVEENISENFSANIEYIENTEENITEDVEDIVHIDEETIEAVTDEDTNVDIVESTEEAIDNEIIEESENVIEETPVENEKNTRINELTNEFKEVLTNIYNSNTNDLNLDSNSIITNYLKVLSSTETVEEIDENTTIELENVEEQVLDVEDNAQEEILDKQPEEIIDEEPETVVDETPIEETTNYEVIEKSVQDIEPVEENSKDVQTSETVVEENVKNVIDIQHIKTLQQNVLSIYNDLSNIADNILNEYDAFSNDFPSLNTNVVPLVNNVPVFEEVTEIEEPIIEDIDNPIDNLVEEALALNIELESTNEKPIIEFSEEVETLLEDSTIGETISIEDIFEDFVEDATISPIEESEIQVGKNLEQNPVDIKDDEVIEDIVKGNSKVTEDQNSEVNKTPNIGILQYLEHLEFASNTEIPEITDTEATTVEEIGTIDDMVEDALFSIIEEPTEEIEDIDANTNCDDKEIADIVDDIIVDEPIKNIIEENVTIDESTIVEEFEEQVFETKEKESVERPLLEIEDNFSNTDEEIIENTILEETITKHDGLDFELNNLLDDELNDILAQQDIASYHNPIKTTENKNNENSEKVILQQNVIDENAPAEEIIAHIKKAEDANKILLISETTQKVYLPYRISELVNYIDYYPNVYKSLQDVVEQEFVLDLNDFMKHPAKARFFETYNLIKNRSGKTTIQALSTAFHLYKNRFLNPAIIAACKSDYELNCYLDALVTDNLDSFNFFKIVYDIKPL